MKPIYFVTTLCTLNHATFVGARFTLLLYAIHLGASPVVLGMLGASFSVLSMLTLVSVGRWADRVGTRRPMQAFNFGVIVCLAAVFVWGSLPALFLAATLGGWMYNSFWVCGQQLIGHMSTAEDRAANYGLAGTGLAVASFTGPLLAGFAIDHVGHGPTLGMLALLGMAPAIMLAATRLRFPGPSRAAHPEVGAAAGAPKPAGEHGIFDLLRHAVLRRVLTMSLTLLAAWDLFYFLMPIRGSELRFSASIMGLVFGGFTTGVFAVRLVVPLLLRRFGQWQLLLVSLAVSAASYVLFVPTASFLPILAVALLLGLAVGTQMPLSSALLYENAPPGRGGEAIGLRVMLSSWTSTWLPLCAGALTGIQGVGPIFLLAGVLQFGVFYANRGQWRARASPGPANNNAS